jgi:glycosyltransferase involved in cell wall biosynthesis
MAPFSILPAWILSKIYGAKLIYEVKDIWPLSLIELGGFSPMHPFIRFMAWFEKFALLKSDIIVSNLQNYGEHMHKDLGIKRDFSWISNGVDLDELSEMKPLAKEIKNKIPTGKFVVGYTGTVGVANALDSFCEAAKLMQENREVVFVIVGDGQEKVNLMQKYANLNNLIFIDAIAKKEVQSMLSLFDVCYLGWEDKQLYRYGTSANKLFDYMYSAKPIINSFSGKGDLVKIVNCGISVPAKDVFSIKNAILLLYKMSQKERDILGSNAKVYVLKNLTYRQLAKKLSCIINKGKY